MTVADDGTGEGLLTQQFLAQIGHRVRERRTAQSLTVQQLADRSDISRRLLTQIELGQANPSLVTITRVARALGTETTTLLESPAAAGPITVQDPGTHTLVWQSEAGSTAYLLAAAHGRTADLWRWELVPGDRYVGQPDPARSQELFHVVSGTLTITADDQVVQVRAGGSARLDSDRAYSYANEGKSPCVFVRVVSLA
ncbi:helix-turn-helix domain-containing protein [Actinomycetota bacterium]